MLRSFSPLFRAALGACSAEPILEWASSDNPVGRDGGEVREVHPNDREWGRKLGRELWSETE